MSHKSVTCPNCYGDGKETCHNPDHGFIDLMSSRDVGRIGCPCCGHDENHKVPNGGECETCCGYGNIPKSIAIKFCKDMDYDYDYIMDDINEKQEPKK